MATILMESRSISEEKDFGRMNITVKDIMDEQNISVYQMSKKTNLRYQTVKSYYNNNSITKVDMEVLAKMCFVLDCPINRILEYVPPGS